MSDIAWRRMLFVAAGLSIVAVITITILVIPRVKNQTGMTHGGDYVLGGIQLFFAVLLFGIGLMNRREGCFTRILLVFTGVVAIIMGLLGFYAISQESEINLFWNAIRACALLDIVIGIFAIVACI